MHWPHKDLLSIQQLSVPQIEHIFDLAAKFAEINNRPVKKVPTLKGKSVVLFFAEPSTRTKLSFDMAGKRLSADTFSLAQSGSSLQKGETLSDTALTLQAMHPDAIVLRHVASGASDYLARHLQCAIINAGDGWHAHPTQALLDGFSLFQVWGEAFAGKNILLLGDIAHSRVARSDIEMLTKLGAKVRVCAPRTLLPPALLSWPVELEQNLHKACQDMDAVICLRLQLERQQAGLLPDLREYAAHFGLRPCHLQHARSDVQLLHPGPVNRGIEIAPELADADNSRILDQVSSGVATRMALLYLYLTSSREEA